MRVCIRRGARQVGGSCVEVSARGRRIVLDAGLPLAPVPYRDLLPPVHGLWATGDGSLQAVVITHGHPDHCGLADLVAPDVDVLAGAATERILDAARFFAPRTPRVAADGYLEHGRTIVTGPFRITPYLVDHSAFDAYALLIEADGRRLLYSGDVRAHGRKPGALERLARAVAPVDTLLLEGTRIAGGDGTSEADVEARCAERFRRTPGLALACFSPQNVDRLVTIYRAARRAGRTFVMDLYTATVAAATGRPTIPQPSWAGVRVHLTRAERRRIIRSRAFDRLPAHRVFADELAAAPERFVMTARGSTLPELRRARLLDGARAVWSLWPGYLDRSDPFADHGLPLEVIHASGHAPAATLAHFARATGARTVVPIHTDRPDAYRGLMPGVEVHADGEWWPV